MPILARDTGGEDFELPAVGMQIATCSHVIDMGLQETPWGPKPKVIIVFELSQKTTGGQAFQISKEYTNSLNKKATLRRDLESWMSKAFTDQEATGGVDIEKLVNRPATLNVIHQISKSGDRTYANIGGIMPLIQGAQAPALSGLQAPKWVIERQQNPSSPNAPTVQQQELPAQAPAREAFPPTPPPPEQQKGTAAPEALPPWYNDDNPKDLPF